MTEDEGDETIPEQCIKAVSSVTLIPVDKEKHDDKKKTFLQKIKTFYKNYW